MGAMVVVPEMRMEVAAEIVVAIEVAHVEAAAAVTDLMIVVVAVVDQDVDLPRK